MKSMEGQRVPEVTFRTREGAQWKDVTTKELFAGKKVVVFSLPGAYTPTCSNEQCPNFERLYDEFRALGVDDHRALVWDEFVGQWIALLPALLAPWWAVLLGFALFRLFDVWKPWPIREFDRRLHGGLGVMVDDVIAGVFAAVGLAIALHLLR